MSMPRGATDLSAGISTAAVAMPVARAQPKSARGQVLMNHSSLLYVGRVRPYVGRVRVASLPADPPTYSPSLPVDPPYVLPTHSPADPLCVRTSPARSAPSSGSSADRTA